jgi:hypothetical protein
MKRCEYIGHITELRGQTALVMIVNNKRMGLSWHPFPESHFREVKDGEKPYFDPRPLL